MKKPFLAGLAWRTWLVVNLLTSIPASGHAGATEVSCVAPRVEIGDVRVYAKDLYVNWVVEPWAHPPCPTTRTGVMLGRSPSTLRPVAVPVTEQHRIYTAYSAFVPLELPLEEAWIAAYAVNANGRMITSRPRMVSGALVTMAPATVRVPDASRIDSCHMNGITLGIAPVTVDGFVSVHWTFKRARGLGPPCGKIRRAGVLMVPTPTRLWLVPATNVQDVRDRREFYLELPAPKGDTVWVVAYAIDGTGYEFRSAPEQVIMTPGARDYHVKAGYGVSPIFEHDGSVWALAHETRTLSAGKVAWRETRSAILRRSPTGQWEVITSLFGEPVQWIRVVRVTPEEVVFIAEERVYRWRRRDGVWSVRHADYTGYFQPARVPLGPTLALNESVVAYHARRVRLDDGRYLLIFDERVLPNPDRASGVHRLTGSGVEETFLLPQPTIADFKRYRPHIANDLLKFWEDVSKAREKHGGIEGSKPGWTGWLRNEIGDYVLDGGRLWFGLKFYGGEGHSGIGGVGVFDPETGRWSVDYHPLLVDSSITLLYIDGNILWLGTLHSGEGGAAPTRGLVRYDRRTRRAVSYRSDNSGLCSWLITEVRRIGTELWVGTGLNGISILNLTKGTWTNYAITPKHAPPNQVRSLGSTCTGVRSWGDG